MSGLSDITANLENSRNCLRRIARHDEQQFSKDSLVNVMEKFVKTVNYMDETILVPCRLMDRQVGDTTDTIPVPAKILSTSSHYAQHHSHHLNGGNRKDRQQTVHEFLSSADLFNLYNMLNSLKNDLLWTRNDVDEGNADDDESNTATTTIISPSYLQHNNNGSTLMCRSTTTSISSDQDVRCKCNNEQQTSGTATATATVTGDQQQQQQTQQKLVIVDSSSNLRTESVKGHIRRPSTASMASSNSVSNLSDSESEISNENDSGIESEGNCGEKGRKCCGNVDKATELARQCRTHLSGLYRCLEQMTDAANYLTARYQSDVGPV